MNIDKIIIHCSDSPHGREDDAETIHRWHKERGWSGIGYHYVIAETGEIQHGRPDYWEGAHASGHNLNSIGICLIGKDFFWPHQLKQLKSQVNRLLLRYPSAKVLGHSEVNSGKSCPNFDVQQWLIDEGIHVAD